MIEVIPSQILLAAYAQGVFPMADEDGISWFSPSMRGLIPLDERFHIPKGLRRSLKKRPFELRRDTAFEAVMRACADREETWIDETILASYAELFRLGHAHSVECWDDGGLQGAGWSGSACRCFLSQETSV